MCSDFCKLLRGGDLRLFTSSSTLDEIKNTIQMKRVEKGLYEMPEIFMISVAVENGFAASPNNPSGDFGHDSGGTEWEEED